MAARMQCRVMLEEPSKIHYGAQDIVTGCVEVKFIKCSKISSTDLPAPLRISILFSGRATSKIWKRRGGLTASTCLNQAPLFSKELVIFNEVFRGDFGETHVYPFATSFPAKVELDASNFKRDGSGAFQSQIGHSLPPSTSFESWYPGRHFECSVAYALKGIASMPGIGSATSRTPEVEVQYSPRPIDDGWAPIKENRHFTVPSHPGGGNKLDHYAKISFASRCKEDSQISFNACLEVPNQLKSGEQTRICVRTIRAAPDRAIEDPPVEVRHISVRLHAITSVRTDQPGWGENIYESSDIVYQSENMLRDVQLTSKNDWTLDFAGSSLPLTVKPSFTTYNIARKYELEVRARLFCAGKAFCLARRGAVDVIPFDPTVLIERVDVPSYEEIEPLPSYAGSQDTKLLEAGPMIKTVIADGAPLSSLIRSAAT